MTAPKPKAVDEARCSRCGGSFARALAGTGIKGGLICPDCVRASAGVATSYRVRRLKACHAVYNQAGERVSPVYRSQDDAISWAERREAARQPQARPCLRCQRPFDSAGLMDRLCPTCGHSGADIGIDNAVVIPSRQGRSAK